MIHLAKKVEVGQPLSLGAKVVNMAIHENSAYLASENESILAIDLITLI